MSRSPSNSSRGFTLVELMVAISVLGILCSLVLQVMSSATRLTGGARQTTDCDTEARYALDQIATDLAHHIRRSDASAFIDKRSGNDRIYFFADMPGYDPDLTNEQRSNISLLGYRIYSNGSQFALQRFAKALPWQTNGAKVAMPYVMTDYSLNGDKGNAGYVQGPTTLVGAFPSVINNESSEENMYQTIAENVIRFEVSILTKPITFDENAGVSLDKPYPSGTAPLFPSDLRPEDRMIAELNRNGLSRISAIVISIAILDPQNVVRLNETQIKTFIDGALTDAECDPNSTKLPMEGWNRELQLQGSSLPKPMRTGVRFYQRVIHL